MRESGPLSIRILCVALLVVGLFPPMPLSASPPLKVQNTLNAQPSREVLWRQEGKDLTNALIRLYCVKMFVTLSWLGALLFRGRAAWLRDGLRRKIRQVWLADLAFFALVTGAIHLLVSPFNYLDFLVQRAYGQTSRDPLDWLAGDMWHLLLTALAVPLLALLSYRIMRKLPDRWWWFLAIGAVPINLLISVLGPIYGDLSRASKPLADAALRRDITHFTQQAGVEVEDIYVEDTSRTTPQPRAYVVGLGAKKRIVLSDNLLREFSRGEILFAVAHEVGHDALGHLWVDVAVGTVSPIIVLFLLFGLGNQMRQEDGETLQLGPAAAASGPRKNNAGMRDIGDPVSFPLFVLIVVILGIFAKPLKNTLSRWIEHEADRYALEHTVPRLIPGSVPVQLFEKIGSLALLDPQPNPAVKVFFFPHPPIDERVDFCRDWGKGIKR